MVPGRAHVQEYQDLGTSKVMLGGGESNALDVNVMWGISG